MDCYLGGLKEELAWDVRLFNPRSVLEATRLAKIKEMSLKSFSKMGIISFEPRKGLGVVVRSHTNQQDQKGILGKPGYRFQTKMTPAEFDEHRAKNLCYFCHDKFTPGHTCPQRQKMHVFFMEIEEQGIALEEEMKAEEKVVDKVEE